MNTAARLAAVQALYQHHMEDTPLAGLLDQLGAGVVITGGGAHLEGMVAEAVSGFVVLLVVLVSSLADSATPFAHGQSLAATAGGSATLPSSHP